MSAVMLLLTIQMLGVYLMGPMDRLRGDDRDLFGTRAVDKLCYGCVVALVLGHGLDWSMLAVVVGMYVGMSIGWGGAVGPALRNQRPDPVQCEWWQRGVLARNAWAALTARGFIWGLCVLPAAYFEPRAALALPAYTLAMPLAIWITNQQNAPGIGNWEDQERYRGWIAGGVMLVGWWIWELSEAYGQAESPLLG